MPEFYVDNIDIEPYEFVKECSKSEIRDLITELVEEGHIPKNVLNQIITDKNTNPKTSNLENTFVENLEKVKNKYYSLTREEEEFFEMIFKKYL